MNEDSWLKDLARRAAERDDAAGVPAPWQALAAGTLPAADEESLRARAKESDEIRDGLELFRPLGSDFHARMVAEMRSRVGPRATAVPVDEDEAARVIAFPHRRRWPQAAAATLAAMFLVVLALPWLLSSGEGTSLPAYEMQLEGIRLERSAEAAPESTVLAPGSAFQIELKPQDAVDGRIGVSFFVTRDGEWREWPVPEDALRFAATGAVRVQGKMTEGLDLEPGFWTLVAVVGRPSDLPSSEEVRACFEDVEGCPEAGGWRMTHKVFQVVSGG